MTKRNKKPHDRRGPPKGQPITQEILKQNADALARVWMLLKKGKPELTSDEFWKLLKKRWNTSRLEKALLDFVTKNRISEFVALAKTPLKHPNGYWKHWPNVETALNEWIKMYGKFPTQHDLRIAGLTGLATAINEYHGGFEAVRSRMSAGTGSQKPKGYWKHWPNLESVLEAWIASNGKFPSQKELQTSGHAALAYAMAKYHGGFDAVRIRMRLGASPKKPPGFWNHWPNLETALREWINEHHAFPTSEALRATGKGFLIKAIIRQGGSNAVQNKLGLGSRRKPPGFWNHWPNVEAALGEWVAKHGHFPSNSELISTGHSSLANAIASNHGGLRQVRNRLGHPLQEKPDGFWNHWPNVEAALGEWVAKHGHFPRWKEMLETNSAFLGNACAKHGGINAVRARMGYGPVTQDLLVANADDLAKVYLQLKKRQINTTSGELWRAIKTRWCEQDLRNAIETFKKRKSLTAFKKLLA